MIVKCKNHDVKVKKIELGTSYIFCEEMRDTDLSDIRAVIGQIFHSGEMDDLTLEEFGLRIVSAIGLDSPKLIISIVKAFTELKPEEINKLSPADCVKIIKGIVNVNKGGIREFVDTIKNLFAPEKSETGAGAKKT